MFPNDVAIVYRHWPLGYHEHAYAAARAAECAAVEGRFEDFHDLLYSEDEWLEDGSVDKFVSMAERVGIRETERFRDCASGTRDVPAIERDIRAAREMGGRGTPALVVNGVYVGEAPDSLDLIKLVREVR